MFQSFRFTIKTAACAFQMLQYLIAIRNLNVDLVYVSCFVKLLDRAVKKYYIVLRQDTQNLL